MTYLFAGDHYYPEGGWKDYRGTFANVGAAKKALNELIHLMRRGEPDWWPIDWAHIVEGDKIVTVWGRPTINDEYGRPASYGPPEWTAP